MWTPKQYIVDSWHGITLPPAPSLLSDLAPSPEHFPASPVWHQVQFGSAYVEIDWTSPIAGQISVSRNECQYTEKAIQAIRALESDCSELRRAFLANNSGSAFEYLNTIIAGMNAQSNRKPNWLHVKEEGDDCRAFWSPVSFPATARILIPEYILDHYQSFSHFPCWKQKRVELLDSLGTHYRDPGNQGLSWSQSALPPHRIAQLIGPAEFTISLLWHSSSKPNDSLIPNVHLCRFPPKWRQLCAVVIDSYSAGPYDPSPLRGMFLANPKHPLIRNARSNPDVWNQLRSMTGDELDPIPHSNWLLEHPSRVAAWMINMIGKDAMDLWNGLRERDPTFLSRVWHMLFSLRGRKRDQNYEYIYVCKYHLLMRWRLYELSPDGWAVISDANQIASKLLPPGSEWIVNFEP